jgi:alcohol dehydrogenase/propanol-preferring alcohol dehydrogenase
VLKSGGYGTHVIAERPEHLIDFGNVDPALAATYACSGLTAYSAVGKLLPIAAEDSVVIIGAGGLGLAAIKILRALNHFNIVVVDVNSDKLRIALEAGARDCVDGRSEDLTVQISKAAAAPITGVVDFVASSATARAGIDALSKGGTYVPVGLYGGDITLQLPTIPLRAIAIRGSYVGSLAELKALVELAKSGALGAMPIERVSHSQPNQALDRVRRGDVAGRLVLEVDAAS